MEVSHIGICIADWTAALGDGQSLVTGRGGYSLAARANTVVRAGLACGPVRGPVWMWAIQVLWGTGSHTRGNVGWGCSIYKL